MIIVLFVGGQVTNVEQNKQLAANFLAYKNVKVSFFVQISRRLDDCSTFLARVRSKNGEPVGKLPYLGKYARTPLINISFEST